MTFARVQKPEYLARKTATVAMVSARPANPRHHARPTATAATADAIRARTAPTVNRSVATTIPVALGPNSTRAKNTAAGSASTTAGPGERGVGSPFRATTPSTAASRARSA